MADAPPLSALYYPHTTIADESMLRHALLLWDRVSFIVPWEGYIRTEVNDKHVSAAVNLVGEEIVPGQKEKDAVYEVLLALVENGAPEWLTWKTPPKADLDILRNEYPIYPPKVDKRIFELLERNKLARFNGADEDIYTNPAMGLLLMALLARECAGTTKHTMTDRAAAYQWLAKYAFSKDSAEHALAEQATEHVAKLHLLSLGALDLKDLPLSRLIKMREREARGDGADYRKIQAELPEADTRVRKAPDRGTKR